MGDTWITGMSHFDYKEEEAHELPGEAGRLAEYFGSIIEATVDRVSPFRKSTGLQCRRRTGRIPWHVFILCITSNLMIFL